MEVKVNACLNKGQVVNPVPEGVLVVDTGGLPPSIFNGISDIDEACRKAIAMGQVDHHSIDMHFAGSKQMKKCATQMVVDYFDDILKYCREHNVKEIQIHQDSDMDAITAGWLLKEGLKNGKLPQCAEQMAEIVNQVDYAQYQKPTDEYITSFPGCVEAIYSASSEEKKSDIISREAWAEFATLDNKVLAEVFPVYDALAKNMEGKFKFDLNKDVRSFIENSPAIDEKIKGYMETGLAQTQQSQEQFKKDIKTADTVEFNFYNTETKRVEKGQMVIMASKDPLTAANLGYAKYGKNTIMAVYAGKDREHGDMYDIGITPEAASILGGTMKEITLAMNKAEAFERTQAMQRYVALSKQTNMSDEQKSEFERIDRLYKELREMKLGGKTRPGQPGGDLLADVDPTPIVARDSLVPASYHSLMTKDKFYQVLKAWAKSTRCNTMTKPGIER